MSRHARVNPSAPPRYRRWEAAVTVLAFLSGAVFALMRLAHATSWPWAWVTSPLWIGGLVILLAGQVIAAVRSPWESPASDNPDVNENPRTEPRK